MGGWWIRGVKVGECGGLEGEVGRMVELRTTVDWRVKVGECGGL